MSAWSARGTPVSPPRGDSNEPGSRSSSSRPATASGGRIWTHHLADGSAVDRGGAWLGPRHDAIFGLAREMGVTTYKTWVKGAHLLIGDGRTRRYTGLIPKISPLAVLTLALAQRKLNQMARQVPLEAPWTARAPPSGTRGRSPRGSSIRESAPRSPAISSSRRCAA